MSFILMTLMCDSVVILWGEIRCKSQLGVKGLKWAKPVVTASWRCLRYLLIGQGSNQNDNFSGKTKQKVFSEGGFSEDPGPGARVRPHSPPSDMWVFLRLFWNQKFFQQQDRTVQLNLKY